MDDGYCKLFWALLVDIYYVIFYSLSASSRLWTCAKLHHDGLQSVPFYTLLVDSQL